MSSTASAGWHGGRTSRFRKPAATFGTWSLVFFVVSATAIAQFKEVGPPPFSPTVARQKIRTYLEKVDSSNRKQTIDTLSGWLVWYRDILDEELIAAWQKDTRANLPEVMESLADSRSALSIVQFSWRDQGQGAFDISYAPMFENLMARFPESAQPILDDLLRPAASGQRMPDLPRPKAETLCRILLDMPDIGTWKKTALEILPHYRQAAESLLIQDLHGSDEEKSYQARVWLNELKADVPGIAERRQSPRTGRSTPRYATNESTPTGDQTPAVAPRASSNRATEPAAANSVPARRAPSETVASPAPLRYSGPTSGTLEYSGNPIPQNGEHVFRNVPLVKMQLDYDTKIWEARLAPGEGQTQRLIVRNKSSGPQKRCVVHWSVIP